ncbi:probable RAP domain-containing protein, chloroplastic [Coccomyxa sp. Obi]|nr:probable RAP domain-containing protein, chloroplastic [Coccomyxa sp. Obi]
MEKVDGGHDVPTGLQSITEYHSIPGTSQAIDNAQAAAVKAAPPEGVNTSVVSPGTPGAARMVHLPSQEDAFAASAVNGQTPSALNGAQNTRVGVKRERDEVETVARPFQGGALENPSSQPLAGYGQLTTAYHSSLPTTGMDDGAQWQAYNAQWAAYGWQAQAGMYGPCATPPAMVQALPPQLPGGQVSPFAPPTPQAQVMPYVAVVNPYSPQFPQFYASAPVAYSWPAGYPPAPGPYGPYHQGVPPPRPPPGPASPWPPHDPHMQLTQDPYSQTGRRHLMGSPPGRPVKRPRTNFAGPVPECVHINKRITAAQSAEAVMSVVQQDLDKFDAVCMATALHTLASMRASAQQYSALFERQEVLRLMHVIGTRLSEFTARNLSNSLWALAKMGHNPGEAMLNAMAAEVAKKFGGCNAQNLANIAWSYATLSHNPGEELLEAIAVQAEKKLAEFSPQNISNLLYAFAKLEYKPNAFLEQASQAAVPILTNFTPQALSNTVWALSKLDTLDETLFTAIVQQVLEKLTRFNAQNVANTVWGFANLGFDPGQQLWDAVAQNSNYTMHDYSPQNIANVLWSYAKMGKRYEDLLSSASAHAAHTMSAFQPQSVANFCWAFATLNVAPSNQCLTALAEHANHTLKQFSPQNISNTAWAVATLQFKHLTLMTNVASEVTARLSSAESSAFSRQHLANLIWSFATLELDPGPAFLRAVANAMAERASNCNPQEISNTVWAYAKLRFYDAAVMDTFANEAMRRIEEFSQQNLLCSEEIWKGIMSQIDTLGIAPEDLPEEALTQIYQAYLLMRVDQPDVQLIMPPKLLPAAHHTWLESCKNVRISALHRDVARVLTEYSISHNIEHVTEDELFSVDIALPDEKIAIEVDGPHHFTANTLAVTGEMLARQKLLKARGWAVISVPFFRWSGLTDTARVEWFFPELAQARAAQAQRHMWLVGSPPIPSPRPPPPRPPPGEPSAHLRPPAPPAAYPVPRLPPSQPSPPPWPPSAYQHGGPAATALIKTEAAPEPPVRPPDHLHALAPASASGYQVTGSLLQAVDTSAAHLHTVPAPKQGPSEPHSVPEDGCKTAVSEEALCSPQLPTIVQQSSNVPGHVVVTPECAERAVVIGTPQSNLKLEDNQLQPAGIAAHGYSLQNDSTAREGGQPEAAPCILPRTLEPILDAAAEQAPQPEA